MRTRHKDPIFCNINGKNAYIFTDDGGVTWCLTIDWLRGRKPLGVGRKSTISGLTLEDAIARAKAWVAGAFKAQVVWGVGCVA